jgi:hypothetical protein
MLWCRYKTIVRLLRILWLSSKTARARVCECVCGLYLEQECSNWGRQDDHNDRICTMGPNSCGSAVWNTSSWQHFWLLEFWDGTRVLENVHPSVGTWTFSCDAFDWTARFDISNDPPNDYSFNAMVTPVSGALNAIVYIQSFTAGVGSLRHACQAWHAVRF